MTAAERRLIVEPDITMDAYLRFTVSPIPERLFTGKELHDCVNHIRELDETVLTKVFYDAEEESSFSLWSTFSERTIFTEVYATNINVAIKAMNLYLERFNEHPELQNWRMVAAVIPCRIGCVRMASNRHEEVN